MHLEITRDVLSSVIISGNGNKVVIYQHQQNLELLAEQPRSPAILAANPYKGLLPFQETDNASFFGREKQIGQLWQRFCTLHVQNSPVRLLPIYGPSGSGKSSLARAGLIPELARRPLPWKPRVQVAVLVPGTHPLESLAMILARMATQDTTPIAKTREFAAELRQPNADGTYDGLRRIGNGLIDLMNAPLIVFVDQFEEVYTLCSDATERDAFIENLLVAARDRAQTISVILTLRSDFLGETQKHSVLNQLVADQGFFVAAMDEDGLRQAIQQPAQLAGYPLDSATVELLIEQTREREGALPLLQFALTRIWDGLANGVTPAATLEQIGGVGGALAGEAQRLYEGLEPEQQAIARRIFLGLVQLGEGTQDTRRRATIDNLISHKAHLEQVKQVIEQFSAPGARLVTCSLGNNGLEAMEVTHEALFSHWKQLNEWLTQSREDLRFQRRLDEAVTHWDDMGRPQGSLWRPPDLDLLRQHYQRVGDDMTPLQVKFLKKSEGAEWFRRNYRRFRLTVLTLTALSAIGFALIAKEKTQEAEQRRVIQMTITAETLMQSTPVEAMLDAIAATLTQQRLLTSPKVSLTPSLQITLLRVMQTNHERNRWADHQREVNDVAFSPDGKTVISASADQTLRLRDVTTGALIGSPLVGHTRQVNAVAFSPTGDQLVSGSADKTLRLWDAHTGQPIGVPLKGHQAEVNAVAFSPDGTIIVSGSADGTLRLWDTQTGHPIGAPLVGHRLQVNAVAFSPDGETLISGGADKTIRLWNAKTGQPIGAPLAGHSAEVNAVAISLDGQTIASGSADKTVRLWDAQTHQLMGKPLAGHEATVWTVAFSPDSKKLVSGGSDQIMRVWDVAMQSPLVTLIGHKHEVYAAVFSPNGQQILSGGRDKTLRLWDVALKLPQMTSLEGHRDGVEAIAFSPDGRILVSGSRDNTLRRWDAQTRKPLGSSLQGHQSRVIAVAVSPDGQTIASSSWDHTLRLWDARTGQQSRTIVVEEGLTRALAFSPDSKTIVSGSVDQTLQRWDVQTGTPIGQPLTGHTGAVNAIAFSPDGKTLVSGSADQMIRQWDAQTGQPIGRLMSRHRGEVSAIAFSPDGKILVSGSADKTLQFWDATTSRAIGSPVTGHGDIITSVAFSPDGKRVASGSGDRTIRLWDVASRSPLRAPLGQTSPVTSVAFSPDGTSLVSSSWDPTIQLWQHPLTLTPETILEAACEQVQHHNLVVPTQPESNLSMDMDMDVDAITVSEVRKVCGMEHP